MFLSIDYDEVSSDGKLGSDISRDKLVEHHFVSAHTAGGLDNWYFHKINNQRSFKIKDDDGNVGIVTGHDINYMLVGVRAGYYSIPYGLSSIIRGGWSVMEHRRMSTKAEKHFFKLGHIIGGLYNE